MPAGGGPGNDQTIRPNPRANAGWNGLLRAGISTAAEFKTGRDRSGVDGRRYSKVEVARSSSVSCSLTLKPYCDRKLRLAEADAAAHAHNVV
jgi:hypothetical protein